MSNQNNQLFDVIVVGGGHSGALQTLLLAQGGVKVVCIDSADSATLSDPDQDVRTTAISYGSHQLMRAAGIWNDFLPYACPIDDIQILDGTSPVLLDFNMRDMREEVKDEGAAFGWIIENHIIHKILHQALKNESNARHITKTTVVDFKVSDNDVTAKLSSGEEVMASLVIGADGRQSFTREWMGVGAKQWSYHQQAVVCAVTHSKPHNNIAVEHFKSEGPFAVLPMLDDKNGNHRSSIVWSQHGKNTKNVLSYDDETFLIALNNLFPDFYGEVTKAENRFAYPLNLIHAYNYIKPRMALIADAAHGIHPIAGQGLNLGLRDVAALSEILIDAKNNAEDIGSISVLKKYQHARRTDNILMAVTTDLLNKLFSNNLYSVALIRKAGLKIVSRLKPAKKFFMRQAMGASGHLPDMIRQGKIK
ncbi:MAG TPA: UbiH/UbiF/VisC/COQ6 family ubiquinone biosynthesis hydroxylase [Alphaproteobacteria bacterium]|nr:UbiH/UbiF/VisC/COQ6 family ubiquinone biosynthesis hydroxylase [Alphaproteobacteria bacterium]